MAELLTYDPSNDPQAIQTAEERDAESLAIGEELQAQQEGLLAGKYKSAQDLEQAYIELQKKLGSQDSEEQSEEVAEEETEETDESLAFFQNLNTEYDENGQLSEESIAQLTSMSSEDLVDLYFRYQDQLEPQQAVEGRELSDQEVSQLFDSVGGEQQYQQITAWAGENLDADTVEAFDGVIESGNLAAINLAIRGLQVQYNDSVGYENNMIQGKPAQSSNGFRSQAEVVRAMQDPRYDRDPAYRQEVVDKLQYSDIDF